MNMIGAVNEAINRKLNSISFTNIIVGTVESLNPLQIRINSRILIGQSFIEPMSLGINDYSPNSALPLVVGEKVQMVRYNNGQRFYILGKSVSSSTINVDYSKQVYNKPSLDTTSNKSLNPLKEDIDGEISLHKIAKTGNYKDLLYKPIIPITFTDNMESDYSISKLPGWQVDLLQKMIDEYVKDNKSINNYILKADGIMFLEDYAVGDLKNKYSTKGKNTRLYTFKKCGPYGVIPHAFQFVGPTSLSYTKYPESGYGVINISNEGIVIYCDNNYRVTQVCQRYELYDKAEKNTSAPIEVVPTNLSRATAFIATEDHQPATKKYVDDAITKGTKSLATKDYVDTNFLQFDVIEEF